MLTKKIPSEQLAESLKKCVRKGLKIIVKVTKGRALSPLLKIEFCKSHRGCQMDPSTFLGLRPVVRPDRYANIFLTATSATIHF